MSPIGHFAAAIPAKHFSPRIPLLLLMALSYALDLIYMGLEAVGLETVSDASWSHSLVMALIWSLLAGLITLGITRTRRNSLVVAAVVFSHWVFDFIVWDTLPLYPTGSPGFGLGVWTSMGFNTEIAGANRETFMAMGLDVVFLILGIITYVILKSRSQEKKVDVK